MESHQFEARVEEIKRRAHGRWTDLLRNFGVDEAILKRRNLPCPLCGGQDRFQYTDKFGEGNFHCRKCGPGGGMKLLQAVMGWDFGTVLSKLEECVGDAVPIPIQPRSQSNDPSVRWMKELAKRLWDEAKPVTQGDEVDCYLCNRGLKLNAYPKVLRFHPALGYYERDAEGKPLKIAEYPAMLSCIQGADGHATTLHRTYLENSSKVVGRDAKRVLSSGINGAAIRLFDAGESLAIAEGIETALAVHLSTGKPVWAAINAGNMEKLWLPPSVRHIGIYADNDADGEYDGQACAFALARRLKKEEKKAGHRQVDVFVPRQAGCDWADIWGLQVENRSQAA